MLHKMQGHWVLVVEWEGDQGSDDPPPPLPSFVGKYYTFSIESVREEIRRIAFL